MPPSLRMARLLMSQRPSCLTSSVRSVPYSVTLGADVSRSEAMLCQSSVAMALSPCKSIFKVGVHHLRYSRRHGTLSFRRRSLAACTGLGVHVLDFVIASSNQPIDLESAIGCEIGHEIVFAVRPELRIVIIEKCSIAARYKAQPVQAAASWRQRS